MKTSSQPRQVSPLPAASPSSAPALAQFFALLFGCFLGLGLLKFGNPVILDKHVQAPAEIWEFLISPWPLRWGYLLLVIILLASIPSLKLRPGLPRWAVLLPLAWLGWQFLASTDTIDPPLTKVTIPHFCACLACYFVGIFALGSPRQLFLLLLGVTAGFLLVIWFGLEQHYGGLEATRRMFYEQPEWRNAPPEYLKKIASDRIFATLVYPNALAGAILLLLPPVLTTLWRVSTKLPELFRKVLLALTAYFSLACLFWSGSKAGWLIALFMLMAALLPLLQARLSPKTRWLVLLVVAAAGIAGFSVKFAPYFKKGATSVGARFEYWSAALVTAKERPLLGSGPGTFSKAYQRIKPPEAEMAQLAHNDYLEQASDSGLPGFLLYTSFILLSLHALRPVLGGADSDPDRILRLSIWLGLLGWLLHAFVEFSLYIPALSWCAFALMGSLWRRPEFASTARPR